jgi:hypothetical protein
MLYIACFGGSLSGEAAKIAKNHIFVDDMAPMNVAPYIHRYRQISWVTFIGDTFVSVFINVIVIFIGLNQRMNRCLL